MSNETINRIPRAGTRQANVLVRLQANSTRGRWLSIVTNITRSQLRDDISRLRTRGWKIETKVLQGTTRYRIIS